MTTKAKEYLVKWLKFEIEEPEIQAIEPKELAFETGYNRLDELDELWSELNQEEIDYVNLFGERIRDVIKKKDIHQMKLILKDLET